MSPPLRIGRLLCALALALGAPALADHGSTQRENYAAAGWPLGDFSLVDHLGKEFTHERLRGRWTFVLVGDTRCAGPCIDALSALKGLLERIAGTAAVKTTQVLFISLDPEHDTAPRLRRYLAAYGARFIGATGARSTLQQLAEEMGVAGTVTGAPGLQVASASAAPTKYTGSLVLIGPDGVIRVEYQPPFEVKRLTAEFLKTRARG
jgi:protein SCO1/2